MATILQEIEVYKRREIAERKAARPYEAVAEAARARVAACAAPRGRRGAPARVLRDQSE